MKTTETKTQTETQTKAHTRATFLLLLASACGMQQDVIDFGVPPPPPAVDDTPAVMAGDPPPPISGGTLMVVDGDTAIAADPDRDAIFVVDLGAREVVHSLDLPAGSEPGRVVEGAGSRIHTVLRGNGSVLSFDRENGDELATRYVCPDPRGIAHAPERDRLFVACADGTLVGLAEDPTQTDITRDYLEPDLRDVLVRGDDLLVSRFREVTQLQLPIDDPGVIGHRSPEPVPDHQPNGAWRLQHLDASTSVVLHQYGSHDELPIDSPPGNGPGPLPPYGGNDGSTDICGRGIVTAAVTILGPGWRDTLHLSIPTPAVDLAVSPNNDLMAIAIPSAEDRDPNVALVRSRDDDCDERQLRVPGQTTAVAFRGTEKIVVQSREPAALHVYGTDGEPAYSIPLAEGSRFDTGHDLFHRATSARIACASCHLEGADDGMLWHFEGLGARRTQSLEVGLAGSAPFHWDGDIQDIAHLAEEVLTRRMGALTQAPERVEAFERWLFSIERPPADAARDEALAEEGRVLFEQNGCLTCHSGSRGSNDATVSIRDRLLQVPALRRVALRPPYMHDARSPTLEQAVLDMAYATRDEVDLDAHEVAAIAEYLRTR